MTFQAIRVRIRRPDGLRQGCGGPPKLHAKADGLRLTASAALLAWVAACATNPVTGRRELAFMSEAQEISIAQESDPEIKREMGVYPGGERLCGAAVVR